MGPEDGIHERKIQRENVDRISSLPDEVLALILSRIPTKCAIGTSILSSRWKYLWTYITSLHFESRPSSTGLRNFSNFVDKVIRNCNSPQIQKFSLICHTYTNFLKLTAWVDEAIKRNIHELDIDSFKLPINIFSCTTLRVLKLYSFTYYYDVNTISFNLPCLKVLHIKGHSFLPNFIKKLISSCPVLQNLSLEGHIMKQKGDKDFTVSAPNLKSLRLQLSKYHSNSNINILNVKAPNLNSLHLSETFINYDVKGDFSSLVKAYVNIEDIFTTPSGCPFQLKNWDISFTLPLFHNLKCLEVTTCDYRFWGMLPKIFRHSPSLEVLTLEQHENDELQDDEYTWVKPKFVPKCLALKLGVIKIEGFKGRNHELNFLKYCLRNAKVLQKLAINCRELTQPADMELYVQLCKFSLASKCCHIQFHERVISNM